MLSRLGSVSWWIGTAVMIMALTAAGIGYSQHMDCPQIMAAHSKNEAAGERAAATFLRDHPDSKGVLAAFDIAVATVDG